MPCDVSLPRRDAFPCLQRQVLLNSLTLMGVSVVIFLDQKQCSAEARYLAAFYGTAISSISVTTPPSRPATHSHSPTHAPTASPAV